MSGPLASAPTRPPPRIALRAPNHLGDAIGALAALDHLAARLPEAQIDVFGPPGLGWLFEGRAGVARVASIRRGAAGLLQTATRLRAGGYDGALILAPSLRGALEAWLGGIPARVGVAWDGRGPLLTGAIPVEGRLPFDRPLASLYTALAEELALALGARAGGALPAHPPTPSLGPGRERRARPASPDAPIPTVPRGLRRAPHVAINPHGRHPTRRWPLARFAEVGRALQAGGAQLTIIGSRDEGPRARALAGALGGGARVAAGESAPDLPGLASLLAQVDLLITNDSGPLHLAAALGTPAVALFGATDPRMTGLGEPHRLLAAQGIPCAPCYRDRCPVGLTCLEALSAGEVLAAARAALG